MARKDIEIISLLLSRSDYTSFNDLRVCFGISERSVRYEVEKANELLKELKLPQIKQNRRFGLKLAFTSSQNDTFKTYMSEYQNELSFYNSDERFLTILFSILSDHVFTFGNKLADSLHVSKSTIDSDMKKIREYVEKYALSIVSVPKKGFQLIGDEWSIRMMVNNTINKFIDVEKVIDYCKSKKVISKAEKMVVDFLDKAIISWTYSTLKKLHYLEDSAINDVSCRQMTVILAVWFKRISNDHFLIRNHSSISSQDKLHTYQIVTLFIDEIQRKFEMTIDNEEKYYLCYLIDSFNIRTNTSLKRDWGGVQMVTLQFIEEMELLTTVPFSEDKDLFERLYQHIEALLNRLKKKVSISNPLNYMIIEQYFDIFKAAKKAIKCIERYSGETISDDEISYITIHFSASKEKLSQYNSLRYRVVVICGHGVATGELLAENLKKLYQFDVIGIVNNYELQAIKRLNADFAFSTIDVEIEHLPSLKINPILSDYDRKKINKFIKENPKIKHNSITDFNATEFFREICSIAEKNSLKINMEKFVDDLNHLYEKNRLIVDKKGVQPMISEVLKDRQILLKKEVRDWEDAIRTVAQPLLEEDYIDENYIISMIDSVKEYGPYIVIGKGIALAHARPEDGVKKLGLSVMTLSNPISFGHDENDPVEIIFCLAAIDNFSHLKIMKTIVSIVNKEQKLYQLLEQDSIVAFKKYIYQFEEE